MKQFSQTDSALQASASGILNPRADRLIMRPLGLPLADTLPTRNTDLVQQQWVIAYPDSVMLSAHMAQLIQSGFPSDSLAAITPETPPHEERFIWDAWNNRKVSTVLITGARLQATTVLERLYDASPWFTLIIEHAHLSLAPWDGPDAHHPYTSLSRLISERWPNRPPLWLVTPGLGSEDSKLLYDIWGLQVPDPVWANVTSRNIEAFLHYEVTQYQKIRRLQRLLKSSLAEGVLPIVIVPHGNDMSRLTRYLSALPVHTLSRQQLTSFTPADGTSASIIHPEVALVIEQRLLDTLPWSWLHCGPRHVIHWQVPWCVDQLRHHVHLANSTQAQHQLTVLYTKEDVLSMQASLKRRRIEHNQALFDRAYARLQFMRELCLQGFHGSELHWPELSQQVETSPIAIGESDARTSKFSSRWMNLLRRLVF